MMDDETRDTHTEEPRLEVVAETEAGAAETSAGDAPPEALAAELEVALTEVQRLQDQSLRRQAELVNFRRRAHQEIAESAALGQGRLLESILPVVDDFERAVRDESDDARAYHEGMQLILRRLHKALEGIGVERIEPHGADFDPEHHEAIARQECADTPAGKILDVFQPGYMLRDRLIRPASVVVAFGGAEAEADARAEAGAGAESGAGAKAGAEGAAPEAAGDTEAADRSHD